MVTDEDAFHVMSNKTLVKPIFTNDDYHNRLLVDDENSYDNDNMHHYDKSEFMHYNGKLDVHDTIADGLPFWKRFLSEVLTVTAAPGTASAVTEDPAVAVGVPKKEIVEDAAATTTLTTTVSLSEAAAAAAGTNSTNSSSNSEHKTESSSVIHKESSTGEDEHSKSVVSDIPDMDEIGMPRWDSKDLHDYERESEVGADDERRKREDLRSIIKRIPVKIDDHPGRKPSKAKTICEGLVEKSRVLETLGIK